jgi:uncharacterized BrkB/YihY/UPF0761 family membrane protein
MSEEQGQSPGSEGQPEIPVVGHVVKKTTRFSAEVLATMISLASAAFGVVAALAWNTAITKAFERAFGAQSASTISLLFVYAVVVTLIGVLVIVFLGRLAGRIKAQPLEFKYPGIPKS